MYVIHLVMFLNLSSVVAFQMQSAMTFVNRVNFIIGKH